MVKKGLLGLGFILALMVALASCSSIPYTGQFILGSGQNKDRKANAEAAASYSGLLTDAKAYIVTGTTEAKMVQRAAARIREAAEKWAAVNGKSEYLRDFQWEYTLIRSNEVNAFCMAGGKIVVFTGILPVAKNEDGLAVVLGHEVAHALLKHRQQKENNELALKITQGILNPEGSYDTKHYSRTAEVEADKVGLSLTVIAGYNGAEAAALWDRMSALGGEPPEFLSTHPSSSRRVNYLRKELPAAQRVAAQVNNGHPVRQFVEKVLTAGGGGLLLMSSSGKNETDGESSSTEFEYAMGADLFFNVSKFVEFNAKIFPADTVNYVIGVNFGYPFSVNYTAVTWYPFIGVDYGAYGREKEMNFGWYGGFGADYHITERLYVRHTYTVHMSVKDGTLTTVIPIKLGLGYAFY